MDKILKTVVVMPIFTDMCLLCFVPFALYLLCSVHRVARSRISSAEFSDIRSIRRSVSQAVLLSLVASLIMT